MQSHVVVKNLLISYSETAGDSGKTLLFLHGWRSDKRVWAAIASQLSAVSCQLVALDLPGFGGSQVPVAPMTVGDYANVVAGFIEKLELKNVIIVGHSFGGRVGIKLSSARPEMVSKLVLVDSAGFVMDASKKKVYQSFSKIVKPMFKLKFMQGLRKKIYKQIGAEDYLATPDLQQTFVNITSEDLTEDLKKIKAPTLIITGENDNDTPASFGKKMHLLIPNSKFLILSNAGHFSFLDQPEEFIKNLTQFI